MKKIILCIILSFGIFFQNGEIFASQKTISPKVFANFLEQIGENNKDLKKFISKKEVWKLSLEMAGFTPENGNYINYVRKAYEVLGKSDDKDFNGFSRKYETLNFLFIVFGINTPFFNDQIMDFKDIKNDDPVVSKCLELGICKGKSGKIFGKNSPITREEFYQYLIKTYSFVYGQKENFSNGDRKFLILENIFETIKTEYYKRDSLEKDNLIYGAAKGMAEAVGDKYTKFFPPVKSKDFNESLNGSFEGIGAYIERDDEGIRIITPMNGSPAKEAGLKANDLILEADGKILKDYTLTDGVAFIKGKPGTLVKLKIKRGNSILNIFVKRGKILVPSVEIFGNGKDLKENPDILKIKINQFGQNTDKELFQILFDNPKSEKIIFDLRDNPGGYLEVAKNILSMFVKSGDAIVKIKYPKFEVVNYSSDKVGKFPVFNGAGGKKIAILTNGGSASASEIFAGTMQDYGLAKVFGETTYGKGTVQTLVDFFDGSQFKITIANWKTGKGRLIEGKGVEPDEIIFQDDGKFGDEVLKKAEHYLK